MLGLKILPSRPPAEVKLALTVAPDVDNVLIMEPKWKRDRSRINIMATPKGNVTRGGRRSLMFSEGVAFVAVACRRSR